MLFEVKNEIFSRELNLIWLSGLTMTAFGKLFKNVNKVKIYKILRF